MGAEAPIPLFSVTKHNCSRVPIRPLGNTYFRLHLLDSLHLRRSPDVLSIHLLSAL